MKDLCLRALFHAEQPITGLMSCRERWPYSEFLMLKLSEIRYCLYCRSAFPLKM